MNTDLATLLERPDTEIVTPDRSHPEPTDEVKMEAITSVADLMEKGTRSTASIQEFLATTYGLTSRPTAIKYRNLAMTLLTREHKPMNRENMRALEVGRLQYHIERVFNIIKEYEDQTDLAERDSKWYDTWAKLYSKLNDFGARLHAIAGLNEITINNENSAKRIVFLRPSDATPQNIEVSEVIEGELSDAAPTT